MKDKGDSSEIVGAFLRVKNEINTIEACLKSIDGIFDKIVIIYVEEPDDGTIAFVKEWCDARSNCAHYAYPYPVFPSRDKRYKEKYDFKNSLAAYNNFGLSKFQPEEWVVKIDGDQIYISDELKDFVSFIKKKNRTNPDMHVGYYLTGYNTFEWHGFFVQYAKGPMNGGRDSYAYKRKNILNFGQTRFYEIIRTTQLNHTYAWPAPVWFHYIKNLKEKDHIYQRNEIPVSEIQFLAPEVIHLYKQKILPLLPEKNIYKKLKLEK